jgi:N utilization substance protein B
MELDLININASFLTNAEKRSLVLHLLYTLESHDYLISIDSLIESYKDGYGILIDKDDLIIQNITEIMFKRKDLDKEIIPFVENWAFDRISVIVRLILRYSLWEIIFNKQDHPLIINEAVELAKGYGEKDSYRFINGILDSFIKNKKI